MLVCMPQKSTHVVEDTHAYAGDMVRGDLHLGFGGSLGKALVLNSFVTSEISCFAVWVNPQFHSFLGRNNSAISPAN